MPRQFVLLIEWSGIAGLSISTTNVPGADDAELNQELARAGDTTGTARLRLIVAATGGSILLSAKQLGPQYTSHATGSATWFTARLETATGLTNRALAVPGRHRDEFEMMIGLRPSQSADREFPYEVIVDTRPGLLGRRPTAFELEWVWSPDRHAANGRMVPPSPPAPAGARVDSEYTVWYATNRQLEQGTGAVSYTSELGDAIHRGHCRVFVPKSHVTGSMGKPWWRRLLKTTDDRRRDDPLRLLGIRPMAEQAFWDAISEEVKRSQPTEKYGVVYIHGFGNTFRDTALRAAQIGFDLSVDPPHPMAFFSWPSQGTLSRRAYQTDEETVRLSKDAIEAFLVDFARRTGVEAVHVIAHSMGNRALLAAMHSLSAAASQVTGVQFGQVMLAAPDVNSLEFRQLASAYRKMTTRTTMYVSSEDFALALSEHMHTYPRAGLLPPPTLVPGIDTIDVADVDLSWIGHGYVGDHRAVLADMQRLITTGAEPDRRFAVRRFIDCDGAAYWALRP